MFYLISTSSGFQFNFHLYWFKYHVTFLIFHVIQLVVSLGKSTDLDFNLFAPSNSLAVFTLLFTEPNLRASDLFLYFLPSHLNELKPNLGKTIKTSNPTFHLKNQWKQCNCVRDVLFLSWNFYFHFRYGNIIKWTVILKMLVR